MAFYHMQMQQENIDTGQYQVTVSDRLNNRPIENARVRISYTGAPDSTIEEVATDSSGRTPVIELKTPPLEYSMEPVEQQPYSEYTIQIEAEGFEPKEIAGSQVLADTLSRQPTTLNVMESGETFQRIVIPPHTLFYEYPPKIEEAEIKPINENGEIVLSKVVVPEYIVVHDGPVNDSAAGNYYVRYKDYIKNVAEYVQTKDGSVSASMMLERFLFPSSVQYTTIDRLSGGEKRRLYLLRILMDAPNVLLLDEPTNDLDIRTLTILEDYLDSFQGIVITVSHDRYFLDRIVRRIFAFEGNGKITQYEGGFTDYQAAVLRKEVEAEAMAAGNPKAGIKSDKSKDEKSEEDSNSSKKTWNGGPKKLRFTYQEQKDWDVIESQIEKLEEEIADLDVQMEKAASDFVKLKELMDRKAQAESELDAKMERWMYLNDLAEKIEKQ